MKDNEIENLELEKKEDKPILGENIYRQKNAHIKYKILLAVALSISLCIFVSFLSAYKTKIKNYHDADKLNIKNQIDDLIKKSADIEAMVNDAKRFKLLWEKTDEKKKQFIEIKISSVNDDFVSLVKKYNISKPSINISVPEVLSEGVWRTQELDVNLINFSITFDALSDKVAIDFIYEFTNKLPGYIIVNNFELKKSVKEGYSEDDLIKISSGEFLGVISSKINFSWYYLRPKTIILEPKS